MNSRRGGKHGREFCSLAEAEAEAAEATGFAGKGRGVLALASGGDRTAAMVKRISKGSARRKWAWWSSRGLEMVELSARG